jgi:hypothetical protein
MPDACPGHHRGSAVRHGLACVLCLVVLGCGDCQDNKALVVAGQNVREIIDPWLLCHDCTDGELDSLTALGKLVPETVESLSTDLLAGPSATRRANIEQQLEESFTEDTAYEASTGVTPTISSTEYVRLYASNYVAVYRARAGVALARIGGVRAGAALDSAIADQLRSASEPLRADVKKAVKSARDSLWAPGP